MSIQGSVLLHSLPVQNKPFAMSYNSSFSMENRLAVCSFELNQPNQISIYRTTGPSIVNDGILDILFPPTCVKFNPSGSRDSSDLFVTCSDCLRLYETTLTGINLANEIATNGTNDPLTCADWSEYQESLILVGSTDATATAIDLETSDIITKVIAHDHPIHDISFCGSDSTFITAGFDGSMRFFDLRDLQSSFIYYQTANPLMRAAVAPVEPNKIATFASGSHSICIIDSRKPGIPLAVMKKHKSPITCIGWSRLECGKIYSTDQSGVLETTIQFDAGLIEADVLPIPNVYLSYTTDSPIESFVVGQNVVAIASMNKIDIITNPKSDKMESLNEAELGEVL